MAPNSWVTLNKYMKKKLSKYLPYAHTRSFMTWSQTQGPSSQFFDTPVLCPSFLTHFNICINTRIMGYHPLSLPISSKMKCITICQVCSWTFNVLCRKTFRPNPQTVGNQEENRGFPSPHLVLPPFHQVWLAINQTSEYGPWSFILQ